MNTTVVSALIAKLTAGCGLVLLLPLLTALFGGRTGSSFYLLHGALFFTVRIPAV